MCHLFLFLILGFLAFDIESPQNFESTPLDGFQIGCACTVKSDGEQKVWFSASPNGMLMKCCISSSHPGDISEMMRKEELASLVNYLYDAFNDGFKIVTWNGLGNECRYCIRVTFQVLIFAFCPEKAIPMRSVLRWRWATWI